MKLRHTAWKSLSPVDFENLCTDLLERLGFQNVRRLGGSSDRGRDIICDREFQYTPELSDRFKWIVQCKHYSRSLTKANLLNDLAAARQHSCDVWWLMTSTKITSGLSDWLIDLGRNEYPFKIGYLDSEIMLRTLLRFPDLILRYLPYVADADEQFFLQVSEIMSKGRYEEALALLATNGNSSHPRHHYLSACCYSMVAETNSSRRENALASAQRALQEAIDRGYLEYLKGRYSWPTSKAVYEIFRDVELQFLKSNNLECFVSMSVLLGGGGGGGGGGCFPPHAQVITDQCSSTAISDLRVGDSVVSGRKDGGLIRSRIVAIHTCKESNLLRVNSDFIITRKQPISTGAGWIAAEDLAIGDVVIKFDGPSLVMKIEAVNESSPVYSLTLDPLPCYFVDGYLSHNKNYTIDP